MMHVRPWRIVRPKLVPRIAVTGRAVLFEGDSALLLKSHADNSIDAIVTDPPYALVSIVKRFGNPKDQPAKGNQAFVRASAGFMGQHWDNGDTAHSIAFWAECLRVLKPGGFVLAFGGTRTYHRLACAIEDAGFEIRDMVQWLYGSGFPKSHNQGTGRGTALKPACEPICMARKPLSEKTVAANVLRWGTGAINIDGCRIEGIKPERTAIDSDMRNNPILHTRSATGTGEMSTVGRFPANVITDGSDEVVAMFPATKVGGTISNRAAPKTAGIYGSFHGEAERWSGYPDSGTTARFFYQAKATKKDRAGSKHPTVKPISLMRYLCRMVTPPGGIVLDPFAGTGTTGEAAHLEGFKIVMMEREARFADDIRSRMKGLNVELTDGTA